MTSKRYVLLEADGDVSPEEWTALSRLVEARLGKAKVIQVEGNGRAVVVKTDSEGAARLREEGALLSARGRKVMSVLTSGSIGKLKRLAEESAARDVGKVP